MTVSRREALILGAAVPMSGLFLASARGQAPQQQQMPGGQSHGEDPILACCLLIDARVQTEICKWAKDKTKNDEVKAFAQSELEAHEKLKADLQRLGYDYPTTPQLQQQFQQGGQFQQQGGQIQPQGAQFQQGGQPPAQPGPGQTVTAAQALTGTPQLAGTQQGPKMIAVGRLLLPPGLAEMVQIATEVADTCIANAKAGLEKKASDGRRFDRAFVGAQLFAHHGELDKLQVFEKHSTDRLREVLHRCRPTCEQQISTLEGIMKKLDDGESGRPERGREGRRPDETKPQPDG